MPRILENAMSPFTEARECAPAARAGIYRRRWCRAGASTTRPVPPPSGRLVRAYGKNGGRTPISRVRGRASLLPIGQEMLMFGVYSVEKWPACCKSILRWFAAISADHPEKLEYIIRHGIAELRSEFCDAANRVRFFTE